VVRPCNCGDCRRDRIGGQFLQLGVVLSLIVTAALVMEFCR
jgi:hypothetical protein